MSGLHRRGLAAYGLALALFYLHPPIMFYCVLCKYMASREVQITLEEGPATYTFMPAQNAPEDLWSHVYTIQLLTCLRLGAVSSILVALRILMANSASDLYRQWVNDLAPMVLHNEFWRM